MAVENVLKSLREKNRLSMAKIATSLGIPKGTYASYEYGQREPNIDMINKIADFYGVTTDYLLGREPAPDPFGDYQLSEEDEKEVIEKYMSFPPEIRACLMDVLIKLGEAAKRRIEARNQDQDDDDQPLFVFKRLSVHKASAGVGYDLYDPDAWKEITVLDCPEAHDADFAVQIEGDSMEPSLHDGDIVYVRIDPEVPVGKVGVFQVDGCGYVKERGLDRLISHNPAYTDIPLAGTESRCIGLVIGVAELPGKCGK